MKKINKLTYLALALLTSTAAQAADLPDAAGVVSTLSTNFGTVGVLAIGILVFFGTVRLIKKGVR